MNHLKKMLWGIVPVAAASFAGTQVQAQDTVNLLEFLAAPSSASTAEFVFTGTGLGNGSGSVGTGFGSLDDGDGDLALPFQDATGLQLVSPFQVFGSPGSNIDTGSEGTTFFDATLLITQLLNVVGPAQSTTLGGIGQTVLSQELSGGAIEIYSTDPTGGGEDPILLLSATVANAAILGFEGSQTGSILSADVIYTGGLILSEAGFFAGNTGELSFSLLDIEPSLSIDPLTGNLSAFQTDATGLFSIVIPEPSTALLLFSGGALLAMRRRQAD